MENYYELCDQTGKLLKVGQKIEYYVDGVVDDTGIVVQTPINRDHNPLKLWVKWDNECGKILSLSRNTIGEKLINVKIIRDVDSNDFFSEEDAELLKKLLDKKDRHAKKATESLGALVSYVQRYLHCANYKKYLEEEPEKLAELLNDYIKHKGKQ